MLDADGIGAEADLVVRGRRCKKRLDAVENEPAKNLQKVA